VSSPTLAMQDLRFLTSVDFADEDPSTADGEITPKSRAWFKVAVQTARPLGPKTLPNTSTAAIAKKTMRLEENQSLRCPSSSTISTQEFFSPNLSAPARLAASSRGAWAQVLPPVSSVSAGAPRWRNSVRCGPSQPTACGRSGGC